MDLIEKTYQKALEVMHMNVTPLGFSATTEKYNNYYSVWARDHSICAIAAVLTKDKVLIDTAKKGILYLLRKQIDHGQVPSYIEIENRKKSYGGLGSITSVDSNMWVVIAAAILYKRTKDRRFISDTNMLRYKKLYRLLKAFDSNDCGLIEVPKAGDWADIFNRTHHVLYDECLYYQALKDLLFLFKEGLERTDSAEIAKKIKKRIRWLAKRKPRVKRKLNELFWFTKKSIPKVIYEYMIYDKIEEEDYHYYQSHLMPFKLHWHKRFDSFGNILALATKIADRRKRRKVIKHVLNNNINKPFPIKSLYPPVLKKHKGWESIYQEKEQPYTYHNGGIWPVIAGFWIYVLKKNKYNKTALVELEILAKYLKKQRWKFNEYMHGKTGKPLGRKYQAWSAAGYIIAYHSVNNNNINLFGV